MREVETPRPQPGSGASRENAPDPRRKARQWRAFTDCNRSLGYGIGCCGNEIADSLRQIFEVFPFWGDSRRRPGSIYTTCPSYQCNSVNAPCRWQRADKPTTLPVITFSVRLSFVISGGNEVATGCRLVTGNR